MTVSIFLARRYLSSKSQHSFVSFLSKFSFFCIALGSFALTLTMFIMSGFEKEVVKNLQNINSDITISANNASLDHLGLIQFLENNFGSVVAASCGVASGQIILSQGDFYGSLVLRGVDPSTYDEISGLSKKLLDSSSNSFKDLLFESNILIGSGVAKSYGLKPGDTVKVLVPTQAKRKNLKLKEYEAIVSGVFKIGIDDYDNNLVVSSLDFFAQNFSREGVDSILLKIKPEQELGLATKAIQEKLSHLKVKSWKDQAAALVSSMALEKVVMFLILALIILIAVINIVSVIYMKIQSKKKDIAMLMVMGASQWQIHNTFLFIGLLISTFACLIGQVLAVCVGFLLQKYPLVQLPDVYVLSTVPAEITLHTLVLVFIFTIISTLLGVIIPARMASRINVSAVLRS